MVLVTISIQVYWNIQNYKTNKQQILNTVQNALENSINNYYNDKARSNMNPHIVIKAQPISNEIQPNSNSDTILLYEKPEKEKYLIFNDSINPSRDSLLDSKKIKFLAEKTLMSIREINIDLKKLSRYLNNEFKNKNLDFDYALLYQRKGQIASKYNNPGNKDFVFSVLSKSSYLPPQSELKILFPDIFFKTLKVGLTGILISSIFSLSIILCLFYLLSIIQKQKQLAIIKNDFISNISHELKTPISVVSSALEGIEKFNTDNEPEKTKKYVTISKLHLSKLHQLIERILETSALESNELHLQKSNTEVIDLVTHIIEKFSIHTKKKITMNSLQSYIYILIDRFHFENVISNLIDNAIKYGGNEIIINIEQDDKSLNIEISDNGNPIEKLHQQKIFDKFYRIPQNNIHNEKGFGIGLYYAKNIISKHNGTLELIAKELTTFKISIPNG